MKVEVKEGLYDVCSYTISVGAKAKQNGSHVRKEWRANSEVVVETLRVL